MRIRAALVGVVLLVASGAIVWVAIESPKGMPFEKDITVKALFGSVSGLRGGADVRVAEVRVGRVSDIRLAGDHALVTMSIPDSAMSHIYRNATATVVNRSLLGQKFVGIQPGDPSAGELPDGGVIPSAQTRDTTQLLRLLQLFNEPTRRATSAAVQQLGVGSAGHAGDLRDAIDGGPSTLPNLGTVSLALSTNHGADFTSLLHSIDDLSGRFANRERQISDLNRQFGVTLDALAVRNGGALEDTLKVAPDSLHDLRGALGRLERPLDTTTAAMTRFGPGAKDLGSATPDLRGAFREAVSPFRKFPEFADRAKPALGQLTDIAGDARPFAPKLSRAVNSAATPLSVLRPYSREIAGWFTNWNGALTSGDAGGHWLRFTVVPATDSLTGNIPGLRDPLTNSDAYPKPGQARQASPQIPLLGGMAGGNR